MTYRTDRARDMNQEPSIDRSVYAQVEEIIRIGRRAVRKAQEESRRLGVPNVYSINGILYYETPSGELTRTDPFLERPDAS